MRAFILTGASKGLGQSLLKELSLKYPEDYIIILARTIKFNDKNRNIYSFKVDFFEDEWEVKIFNKINPYIIDAEEICFINNAGSIEPITNIGKYSSEDIKLFFNLNINTPIKWINHLVQIAQISKKKLEIINITSGAANRAIAGWSLYCTAKCAVKMYLENLKIESDNVKVVNIDPGVLNTEMQEKIRNSYFKDVNIFRDLALNNELKSPDIVAKQIINDFL